MATPQFIERWFESFDNVNQGQGIDLKQMNLFFAMTAIDESQFQNEKCIELFSAAETPCGNLDMASDETRAFGSVKEDWLAHRSANLDSCSEAKTA